MRSSHLWLVACVAGMVLAVASCTSLGQPAKPSTSPPASSATATPRQATPPVPATPAPQVPAALATPSATDGNTAEPVVNVVAAGLDTPWALAFAPDGRLFFTERPGRIRVVENGRLRDQPVATIPVRETAESGLMGLAIDPDFPTQPYLYAIYTYAGERGLRNRLVRLRLDGDVATDDLVLLDDIPAGNIHDGGRVKVGPDGLLYFTTGDAAASNLAQDPQSLAGKILRLNRDGTVPADNPFPGSPVYTLGHRNPQGLAWQPNSGRLYATEHGPTGNDEVNLVEPGHNYGWPEAQGPSHPTRFRAPLVTYSPAVAPAGATFYGAAAIPQWSGSFFFATLRGTHLHRLTFDPANPRVVVADERLYQGEYGRLRDVVEGPDGALYVATSNRDGRGSPSSDDDRILRIGLPPAMAAAHDTPQDEWQIQEYPVPRGAGPHDVAPAPDGTVYYASLAGSHIARVDLQTGSATAIDPPTPNQGARRVWSDSKGRIWVSEWNVGLAATSSAGSSAS